MRDISALKEQSQQQDPRMDCSRTLSLIVEVIQCLLVHLTSFVENTLALCFLCLGVFQKVRNEGSRRSAVRAEPIKEHETVDMKLAHLF